MKKFYLLRKLAIMLMITISYSSISQSIVEEDLIVNDIHVGKSGSELPQPDNGVTSQPNIVVFDPREKYMVIDFNKHCGFINCGTEVNKCAGVDTVLLESHPLFSELYSILLSAKFNESILNVEFTKISSERVVKACLLQSVNLL